jgi:hypothetical protein
MNGKAVSPRRGGHVYRTGGPTSPLNGVGYWFLLDLVFGVRKPIHEITRTIFTNPHEMWFELQSRHCHAEMKCE